MTHPLPDPNRHFWLARSVARSVGISLSEAIAKDALSVRTYSTCVHACQDCTKIADCEAWLSKPHSSGDALPDGCALEHLLDVLRSQ